MEKFVIQGGIPLKGEVTPSGNKNAALPLLAATLLTTEPVILHNLPEISDVRDMRQLLESIGVEITQLSSHSWQIQAKDITGTNLDPTLCTRIRASVLLAGPLIARTGKLQLPPPGGDVIGKRRIDTHILALQSLGANISY
ncbi:MAG: UDP-N-acetylglucosamine 1-carboxyvinyltransferase, partial [Anaerolineales bacterium]